MRKQSLLKTMLLLCALIVGSSSAWAEEKTYSLTPDNTSTSTTSTSYITTMTEFTYNDVKWKMNQWNPSTLQVKTNQDSPSSEFRFYNTSAFAGRITKVVITFSSLTLKSTTETGFKFVGGTSEVNGTTGGTDGIWNSTNKTLTWEPRSTDNYTYFALYQNGKVATGTNKLAESDAIVVTYETASSDPCTVTLDDTGVELVETSAGAGVTLPTRQDPTGYVFVGWCATNITEETTIEPNIIPAGTYYPAKDITLYPLYSNSFVGEPVSTKTQILQYDTWTYYGNTTDKSSYRFFSKNSYIESDEFDLSKLSKVIIYGGGTFGTIQSGEEKSLTIGDESTVWATLTASGTSQTRENVVESDVVLSGNGKLRITSNCGTSGSSGIRISKIEIFTLEQPVITHYTSIPVSTVDVTVTAATWASFSSSHALNFSETGITVYTATDGETSVTLNEISTGKVPAGTPVLLYKSGADGTAINVPVIASADVPAGINDLHVVGEGGLTGVDNVYVLSKPSGKEVGFYLWDKTKTLNAGKIYLQGKASYGARSFLGFAEGETTSIDVRSKMDEVRGEVYNLNGQRVAQPTKGLYIVNGKKVVVK